MSPVSIILLFLLSLNVASSFKIDTRARQTSRWGQDDDDFISYDTKKDTPRLRRSITIYPGTKWCGDGDEARDYNDLGSEWQTDMCCRAHDHCDFIPAGETLHGLTNVASYSRSSCECDEEFRRCLIAANRNTAQVVGWIYFNQQHTQCFRRNGLFGYEWYDVNINQVR